MGDSQEVEQDCFKFEIECKSKFEKYGGQIKTALGDELLKIKNASTKRRTRLYEYQLDAVLKTAEHFEPQPGVDNPHYKAALIVAPPGSGKSGMVTLIPYALNSKKVLILTPSKIISEQLAAEFGYPNIQSVAPFFIKCGLFHVENRQLKFILETPLVISSTKNAKDMMGDRDLVIINAQKFSGKSVLSLTSDRSKDGVVVALQEFDTIIVDEAHHYPARTWSNVLKEFAEKRVIFLTATPFRGNEQLIEQLNSDVTQVVEIRTEELEGKTIRRCEFIERSTTHKSLRDPEFLQQLRMDIEEILTKHAAMENRAKIAQAMILVRTKAECKEVALGLGPDATFVTSDAQGDTNLADFTDGRKKIVVVCGMLREGYDNSSVTLVVILRKCKSRVLFEQFCGRCMRIHRNLTGKEVDRTLGTVLSYDYFEQSQLWAARSRLAVEDPVDEDEEEEVVAA